jgi:hypothetical protein
MNQFGLIIQETTAGSNLQFVSSHLDENTPEIRETITDERTLAAQLANMSDVYAVQITKNFKVYSLIVTDHRDFLGRSGFYAIRLYGPKGVNLMNFEKTLADIKDKYIADTNSNNLNNQNYNNILSSILILENDINNFISLNSNANCYVYFDEFNSLLSTVFNTKGINLIHKVYAFNKTKAVPENIVLSTGLKSYGQINSSQKEINIVNNYAILKELKINHQNVDYNPNLSELTLICQSSDSIVFNTTDDQNFRPIPNNFISIERKHVPRPVSAPYRGGKKKTFWEENGIYLGILLLTIMMAGGSYYYFEMKKPTNKITDELYPNTPPGKDQKTVDSNPKSEYTFELIMEVNDSVYQSKYPKLEKYRFRFKDKNWLYKNTEGKDRYVDFKQETVDDIIKKDSLNMIDLKKDEFIKQLIKKSGHPVLNKEIVKPNTSSQNRTNNNMSTSITTQHGSSRNNNSSTNLPTKNKTDAVNTTGMIEPAKN